MENISESLLIKTTNIIPCHLFFFSPQSIYPTYEDIPKYTEYSRTFLGNEKNICYQEWGNVFHTEKYNLDFQFEYRWGKCLWLEQQAEFIQEHQRWPKGIEEWSINIFKNAQKRDER